jgi:hypothetical protein
MQASSLLEDHLLSPANDDLPLIVSKAEDDARSRVALNQMGFLKVLAAYLRHKAVRRDVFHSLAAQRLWPTMDFVREWLKQERQHLIVQNRLIFLLTMLGTLVAGLAFVGALAILG